MDISKITNKDKEVTKYFIIYLEGNYISDISGFYKLDFAIKLNELIGTSWTDWFITLLKLDIIEYNNFKEITKDGILTPYFRGDKNSPAYKWLIKIWREIQLEKLEI
jgi:hypothetical protein